jgi:hypothetical protein
MSKRSRPEQAAAGVEESKQAGTESEEEEVADAEDAEDALQNFVNERTDEELLTIFSTCRETMRNLRKQFLHEVKPLRDSVKTLKTELLHQMNEKELDALQVEESTYIRRVLKQGNGRKLISATFQDVFDSLCKDPELVKMFVDSIQKERKERLDKWYAKQKQAKRGKLGPRAALESQVVGFAAPPPDPGPRVFGKNKVHRRKLTPISRDMTVSELAAEVAYQAVHQSHRPLRHVLNVTKTLGRGRNSAAALKLAPLGDVKDPDIAPNVRKFLEDKDTLAEHSRDLSEQRTKHRRMLDLCQPRISEYISTMNPGGRVVRRCFQTESGPCTVSIAVKTREYKARALTLWDVSEAVDSIAGSVAAADDGTDVVSAIQACLGQIQERIAPLADELLEKRVKTVQRVMDRRVRPKEAAVPGNDGAVAEPNVIGEEEEDEGADYEDDADTELEEEDDVSELEDV